MMLYPYFVYCKCVLNFTADGEDIIDEALLFFKSNIFFRNYEIKVGFIIVDFVPLLVAKYCFDMLDA